MRHPSRALMLAFVLSSSNLHCSSSSGPTTDGGADGDASMEQDARVMADAHGLDGSAPPDGGPADAGPDAEPEGCGDGVIQATEVCDDGNSESGDGCGAQCDRIEQNYVCPTPGQPCVSTVECGDGTVSGMETCDDGNMQPGDGCSEQCTVEQGWTCPTPGSPCRAASCGDGLVAGDEQCDDGNTSGGDGCDSNCQLEDGYVCPSAGQQCETTTCGDGVAEGSEECDDGNKHIGDGCTPFCEVEPDCTSGSCEPICGDGQVFPGEECDDGNLQDGDGCSSTCELEAGFDCTVETSTPPEQVDLPIVYRDFQAYENGGHVAFQWSSNDPIDLTPDQDIWVRTELGTAADTTPSGISLQGKPIFKWYAECDGSGCTDISPESGVSQPAGTADASECNAVKNDGTGTRFITADGRDVYYCGYGAQDFRTFSQWYRDVDGVNRTIAETLTVTRQSGDTYVVDDNNFFPLDGRGFGNEDWSHNFHFTDELRYFFQYDADKDATLTFDGDDDVWVFLAGKLVVDISGTHGEVTDSVTVNPSTTDINGNPLNLEDGQVYEMIVFHAERNTSDSNYRLTLDGFFPGKTECTSVCGDGVVTGDEVCDNGTNEGNYGGCMPGCQERGPVCGDGTVQEEHEQCDDGTNLTNYSNTGEPGCAPGCELGAYCGDGEVNSTFGEECDNGEDNQKGYGECKPNCTFDARCGDGVVQDEFGEECDDGNLISNDGCSDTCQTEGPF